MGPELRQSIVQPSELCFWPLTAMFKKNKDRPDLAGRPPYSFCAWQASYGLSGMAVNLLVDRTGKLVNFDAHPKCVRMRAD